MSQQDKKTSNGNINMHIKQYYYISFKIQNLASFYGIYIQTKIWEKKQEGLIVH